MHFTGPTTSSFIAHASRPMDFLSIKPMLAGGPRDSCLPCHLGLVFVACASCFGSSRAGACTAPVISSC